MTEIESALLKLKEQKRNYGFMDRFTVDENYEVTQVLEKQIPKKAEIDDEYSVFICPTCQRAIAWMNEKEEHNFCLNCGQKLRWSDDE